MCRALGEYEITQQIKSPCPQRALRNRVKVQGCLLHMGVKCRDANSHSRGVGAPTYTWGGGGGAEKEAVLEYKCLYPVLKDVLELFR